MILAYDGEVCRIQGAYVNRNCDSANACTTCDRAGFRA